MGPFYLIIALLIQNSYTETLIDSEDEQIESREILKIKPECDGDDISNEVSEEQGPKDWLDIFAVPENKLYPTSSAALMAQATESNKPPEEQLDDIKQMAEQISSAFQSDMANLLSYAVSITDTDNIDNKLRKRRSIETPMDSTQLVMRLLKHIKCNNEYQNIAIEKMMSAQEIADKYGIAFNPDAEILSDLAVAANEQAKEMSEILKDSLNMKNSTTTLNETTINDNEVIQQNATEAQQNNTKNLIPCEKAVPEFNHDHHDSFSHYNYYHNYPYESQIMTPPHHHQNAPVSPRPSFYDYISYNPEEFSPYCSMDMAPIFLPMDEPILSEPELVGEEFEETVSSKVCIDHDEPGLSTVNHVTTYTVSEKAHFRSPQLDNLSQQMQYYFFLM